MIKTTLIPFLISISAAYAAQILKVFYYKIQTNKWNWKVVFTSGGTPSSHTSAFAALVTSIYIIEGTSTSFSIALAVLVLVMHDAVNIRWFGGVSSQKITNLTQQLFEKQLITINNILKQKSKSVLGHKVSEVVAGLVVGILFAIIVHMYI